MNEKNDFALESELPNNLEKGACGKKRIGTGVRIKEFKVEVHDTEFGPEEITRDIPNLSDEALQKPRLGWYHPHRGGSQTG